MSNFGLFFICGLFVCVMGGLFFTPQFESIKVKVVIWIAAIILPLIFASMASASIQADRDAWDAKHEVGKYQCSVCESTNTYGNFVTFKGSAGEYTYFDCRDCGHSWKVPIN